MFSSYLHNDLKRDEQLKFICSIALHCIIADDINKQNYKCLMTTYEFCINFNYTISHVQLSFFPKDM